MKRLIAMTLAAAALALIAGDASAGMKKVRIGTEGAYRPFNYIDAEGRLAGFDIDIAKALCKTANFDCTFVRHSWEGIIAGLLAKKYDAIIASMSITDERKEVVDFTDKYYSTPAKFVARKGSDFEFSPEGLAGKTVGVQRGTVHENFLRDNFPDIEIKLYATQEEANAALASGRVDLVMADRVVLADGFLKTEAGRDSEFVGPDYNDPRWHGEGVGIALRKEDDALREAFNRAIDRIRADGTYRAIQAKYFDFDVYGKPAS